MDNLHRDELTVPLVAERFAGYHQYIAAARDMLIRGRSVRGLRREETRAAIGHALAFPTWRSLTREQGLDDGRTAQMMCRMVDAAAGG